jgi:putative CocE/NonD family hydrolase
MKTRGPLVTPTAAFALFILLPILLTGCKGGDQPKVSALGAYRGYSEQEYDGFKRASDFLALASGTRLAYDLYLPTKKGIPTNKALPVLLKYTPYDRTWTVFDKKDHDNLMDLGYPKYGDLMLRVRRLILGRKRGGIKDAVNRTEWLREMLFSGYAVVVVDRPGTGASFGTYQGDPEVGAHELDEILNWIAAQEWSNGKIGMFGDSIQAQVQFRAASTGNPHLKAILPATTWMDNYSAVMFPGGVPNKIFAAFYAKANRAFDKMATPVDGDKDGALLAQARAERSNASALAEGVSTVSSEVFRDGETWLRYQTLYPLLDKVNRSRTPVYLINGWYDIYARDNFLIYDNLTVPKRLLVRPTDHSGIEAPGRDINYGAEAHRWFDYWLKGIDNGIMDEPPINYYLQNTKNALAWKSADAWPLRVQRTTRYYLIPGTGRNAESVNNGVLSANQTAGSRQFDEYTADYTTTTGKTPHWVGLALPHKYPNMRSNDAKALTYTTSTLETALTLVGHSVAHIWLSTDAPDLDLFAYLEAVDGKGNSRYVTQGNLRASHRALGVAPFVSFGLPWHSHARKDVQPIVTGKAFELVFDLLPTAYQFTKGSRIRIAITLADSGNFNTPVLEPAPKLRLLNDADHPSYVELPVSAAP